MDREPVSAVLIVSVDIDCNLDEPLITVGKKMEDGIHIISAFHREEAVDLYDYLMGEGAY